MYPHLYYATARQTRYRGNEYISNNIRIVGRVVFSAVRAFPQLLVTFAFMDLKNVDFLVDH
jgi:hypothetical protein